MRAETIKNLDNRIIFSVLIILALLIRIGMLFYTQNNILYYPDENEYVSYAQNIAEGKGFTFNGSPTSLRPPLYPFFLAGLRLLAGSELILAARIIQTLLNLLTGLLVYQIGKKAFQQRIAWFGSILFLYFPPLLGYNLLLLSETIYIFLFVFATYFFVSYLKDNQIKWLIFTGISLGFAALTRDITTYFMVLMVVFLWFYLKFRWQKRLFHLLGFFLAFWLVITPWVIRNTLVQGKFMLISTVGALTMYWSNKADTPLMNPRTVWEDQSINKNTYYYDYVFQDSIAKNEVEKQQMAFQKSIDFILHHPILTLYRSLFRAMDFLSFERLVVHELLNGWYGNLSIGVILFFIGLIFSYYIFIAIMGFYGLTFSAPSGFKIFVVGWSTFNILMHALVLGHPRYHLALVPWFCLYGAYGTMNFKTIWQERKTKKFALAAALGVVLIAIWIFCIFVIDAEKVIFLLQQI